MEFLGDVGDGKSTERNADTADCRLAECGLLAGFLELGGELLHGIADAASSGPEVASHAEQGAERRRRCHRLERELLLLLRHVAECFRAALDHVEKRLHRVERFEERICKRRADVFGDSNHAVLEYLEL